MQGELGLTNYVGTRRIKNGVAAGTTAITSDTVTRGSAIGLTFMALIGAISTGGSCYLKIQGSANNSDWSELVDDLGNDVRSVTLADTDDNELLVVDIGKAVGFKYYRAVLVIATANVVLDGITVQYNGMRDVPPTTDYTPATSNVSRFLNPEAA